VINVGVIIVNGKALIIDSGEGDILKAAESLGISEIEWVLYTHFHRDQCAGAGLLEQSGVKLAVPASEEAYFHQATEFWNDYDCYFRNGTNFRPNNLVLRSSVQTDRQLAQGDSFNWQGLTITVLGTPGHTDGHLSYMVDIDDKRIIFSGDLIYGPGKIWEFYSLAGKGYGQSFGGAVGSQINSLHVVKNLNPSILIPSHGLAMESPGGAINMLIANLYTAMGNYHERKILESPPSPGLPPWVRKIHNGPSYLLQASDGTGFLIDVGWAPGLVDSLPAWGVAEIDMIWASHYHFDHVEDINTIVSRYGSDVYIQTQLADVIENPVAYELPCIYPYPIEVTRPLKDGETFYWKGYKCTSFYFPSQTIYHDALLVEYEGSRVLFTGDSFYSGKPFDDCVFNRNLLGEDLGFEKCYNMLLNIRPDVLVTAHTDANGYADWWAQQSLDNLNQRELIFSRLFPWSNVNFGMDPHWIRLYPYVSKVVPDETIRYEAVIYNHSNEAQEARVELRAPEGWTISQPALSIVPAKSEGRIIIEAKTPADPVYGRQVLGLAVRFGSRNLGEVAEAIVEY